MRFLQRAVFPLQCLQRRLRTQQLLALRRMRFLQRAVFPLQYPQRRLRTQQLLALRRMRFLQRAVFPSKRAQLLDEGLEMAHVLIPGLG